MRHTTYSLRNTHAIESKPHTPPPSDVSKILQDMNDDLRQNLKWMNSLQRFLMPLFQRCKQHLPTMEQQQRQTQRCQDQVNLLSDRSSTQSFTCTTRLTCCNIHTRSIETKPRTHRCHRQVKFLSDRSSTQSFTCATRLTSCKIHTQ